MKEKLQDNPEKKLLTIEKPSSAKMLLCIKKKWGGRQRVSNYTF